MNQVGQDFQVVQGELSLLIQLTQCLKHKNSGGTMVRVIISGIGQDDPVGTKFIDDPGYFVFEVDSRIGCPSIEGARVADRAEPCVRGGEGCQPGPMVLQKIIDSAVGKSQGNDIFGRYAQLAHCL